MPVFTTAAPASEPISLADAKNYLRIHSSVTADDGFVGGLIVSAREYVERVTARRLISQEVTEYFDSFGTSRFLSLHLAPVSAVSSVSYIPSGGTPASYTTWDNTGNSKYFSDLVSGKNLLGGARVIKRLDVSWPSVADYPNSVKVVYTSGYGSSGTSVPSPLLQAMYLLIGHWYYEITGDEWELVQDLLTPYKVHK